MVGWERREGGLGGLNILFISRIQIVQIELSLKAFFCGLLSPNIFNFFALLFFYFILFYFTLLYFFLEGRWKSMF